MFKLLLLVSLAGIALSRVANNASVEESMAKLVPDPKPDSKVTFDPSNVRFFLYTNSNPNSAHEIFVGNSGSLGNFNSGRATKFLIHGYTNSYTSDSEQLLKNAYLDTGTYNIICVDWSPYNFPYWDSVEMAKPVGNRVGQMIKFLLDQGLSMSRVHVIGHSLGAHISGYASQPFGPSVIERITALDPAAPSYTGNPADSMVERNDAKFVDVIHTSIRMLGLEGNIGDVDFYPEGGKYQPDCDPNVFEELVGSCDHSQAYIYFANSIRNGNRYVGNKCNSLNDALNSNCNGATAVMGNNASPSNTGIYYVNI